MHFETKNVISPNAYFAKQNSDLVYFSNQGFKDQKSVGSLLNDTVQRTNRATREYQE